MHTSTPCFQSAPDFNLDIDRYLNKIIPPSPVHRFPQPLRRLLGYRSKPSIDVGNVWIAFWALVGTFAGLLLVAAVFRYTPWIEAHQPPVLIASLGAAAILEYNAIASPLAQPRNACFGHAISALIGIAMAKSFSNLSDYSNLRWIAGPLACGLASAAMTLTNTVHPPGGATAVLAVVEPTIKSLGWMFLPFMLIACALMLAVAVLLNNIQRRYPVYWWSPLDTGSVWKRPSPHDKIMDQESCNRSSSHTIAESVQGIYFTESSCADAIILSSNGLLNVPMDLKLEDRERAVLETLLAKLQAPRLSSNMVEKHWM